MTMNMKSPRRERNLAAALEAAAVGCPVFPCNPQTKAALVKWKEEAATDPDKIKRQWKRFPNAIPALVTGSASGFVVVDLDVKNGKDGVTAYRELGLDPNDAGAVVRTASGGRHLYFDYRDGVRNAVDKLAPGIDIRGEGGYVIAPGADGDVGTYELLSGCLDAARMLGFELPEQFWPMPCDEVDRNKRLHHATPEAIRSALYYIPNDESYEDWLKILMAVHHGFDGAIEGLSLVQEWCAGYPDYCAEEVTRKWRSFDASEAGGITVATLFSEAREHGWNGQGVSLTCNLASRIHPSIKELMTLLH